MQKTKKNFHMQLFYSRHKYINIYLIIKIRKSLKQNNTNFLYIIILVNILICKYLYKLKKLETKK